MQKTILAATLHDPKGSLEAMIGKYGHLIGEQHEYASVALTAQSNPALVKVISDVGINCFVSGTTRRETYMSGLSSALECSGDRIFFCDFDRVLHWVKSYLKEYTAVQKHSEFDFLLLGRTHQAFASHPKTQKVPEGTLNYYCSNLLGKMLMDFGAAVFCMTKEIAKTILGKSKADYGIYAEWPMIAATHAKNFGYVEVDGLEWETSDRFDDEIRKKGRARWLREFQSPQEWALRNILMHEGIEAAYQQVMAAKDI